MRPVEFRRQVFRTDEQWAHGLSSRLRRLAGGGLALYSVPAFDEWATRDSAARNAGSVAADRYGRLFWIHRSNGRLYRLDPVNGLVEPVAALTTSGDGSHVFGRLIAAADRLWVLDVTGSRVIALRPDTFQIISEIALDSPIDIAFGRASLFTLDAAGFRVFAADGTAAGGPYRAGILHPLALGVGADGGDEWIYRLDACARGFLRYRAADGAFDSEIGTFDSVSPGFHPRLLAVDASGSLFVSDGSPVAHEFAPDGGYVGAISPANALSAIRALSVNGQGDLLMGSPQGIARFSRQAGAAGNAGVFYTRVLDNGQPDPPENGPPGPDVWHRIDFMAELDSGGSIDVSYATARDAGIVHGVEAIFAGPGSAADKVELIEAVLGDRWTSAQLRAATPEAADPFARTTSHSVLFGAGTQRYVWLKVEVLGLAPKAKASIREMRVYYPRLSYLRYLPAVYQQDAVSRDLLQRFLAMFETVLSGLEETIERIPEAFDPTVAPDEFLAWLAQWLDLGIEEDWPASVTRELIQKASELYQQKGTPRGLSEFVRIVTRATPIIRESFEAERPFVLGDRIALGIDSRILPRPTTDARHEDRTVLGHAAALGHTGIRPSSQVPVDPFRAAAHRFTVLLDLPRGQFDRHERGLRRIIRENAPAHVGFEIQRVSGALGAHTRLGINTRVTGPQPTLLGHSALGESICTRHAWYGPQIDMDATLAGHASEPPWTPDYPDGE